MRPGIALQQVERDDDMYFLYLARFSLLKIETWEALLLQLMHLLLPVGMVDSISVDESSTQAVFSHYPRVTFSTYPSTIQLADTPRDLLIFSHPHFFFGPRM